MWIMTMDEKNLINLNNVFKIVVEGHSIFAYYSADPESEWVKIVTFKTVEEATEELQHIKNAITSGKNVYEIKGEKE